MRQGDKKDESLNFVHTKSISLSYIVYLHVLEMISMFYSITHQSKSSKLDSSRRKSPVSVYFFRKDKDK